MKRRECTERNEEKSGANIVRGSLGHCSHICLLERNINVWRSGAAEGSSRDTDGSISAAQLHGPTPLLCCFMVPARSFCFKRLIVVGSELEVRSFCLSSDVSYEISTKAL